MYSDVFCLYVACILKMIRIHRNTSEYILEYKTNTNHKLCVDTDVPEIHLQTHPEYIQNTPELTLTTP